MGTRLLMTALLALPVNAVFFGVGTLLVLGIPALSAYAAYLLPLVVLASLAITGPMCWSLAPLLRSKTHGPDVNRKG